MRMSRRPVRKDVYRLEHEEEVYSEYCQEAARLVIETGRAIAEVACGLNLSATLVGRWVKKERDRTGQLGGDTALEFDVNERSERDRLRRGNAELRMNNEFLGKPAAFFASKHRK